MSTIKRYVKDNVFCRCGQAVSRLVASDLIPRPEMPSSESEVYEWWLVSPDLAVKLRTAGLPTLQFGELNMWGRTSTGGPLEADPLLIAAISPSAAPVRRRRANQKAAGSARAGAKRSRKTASSKRR